MVNTHEMPNVSTQTGKTYPTMESVNRSERTTFRWFGLL